MDQDLVQTYDYVMILNCEYPIQPRPFKYSPAPVSLKSDARPTLGTFILFFSDLGNEQTTGTERKEERKGDDRKGERTKGIQVP